eukprot:scpid84591/ scgid11094/ 
MSQCRERLVARIQAPKSRDLRETATFPRRGTGQERQCRYPSPALRRPGEDNRYTYKLQPNQIWNCGEKGFNPDPLPSSIVASQTSRATHQQHRKSHDCITANVCVRECSRQLHATANNL